MDFYTKGMEVFLIILIVYLYDAIRKRKGYLDSVLIILGWLSIVCLTGNADRWLYSIILAFFILLFLQDMDTMYFSYHWLFPVLGICAIWWVYDSVSIVDRILGMVLYGGPALIMHICRKEWIGSADCIGFLVSGWMLGWERMIVAFMVSVGIALIWSLVLYLKKKEPLIPYISCLCVGLWISLLRGYTIFYFFSDILRI